MPSLGGLLKKRRKDSQDLASEQASDPSNENHDGSSASMQPAVSSQASPHQQPQGSNNAASINNIINSPSNAGQSAQNAQQTPSQAQGQGQQAQKERTTRGKYSQDDFSLQRTLGTGSFGRVHLVQSKHNHRFYAMKVLKKAQVVKMKQIEHTNDERRMLNRVRHPFLVTLWGTWQDSRNLYMVMDFVEGGELFSLLRKSQVSFSGF
jgi:protein kinase A